MSSVSILFTIYIGCSQVPGTVELLDSKFPICSQKVDVISYYYPFIYHYTITHLLWLYFVLTKHTE